MIMNYTLFAAFFLLSLCAYGQASRSEAWDQQAQGNVRLQPKFGYKMRSADQKAADDTYIHQTLTQLAYNGDAKAAAVNTIALGFNFLNQRNLVQAMYRFNQAYLLDSMNADIYWGFGAVYLSIGAYQKALEQYQEGIRHDPKNAHILSDLGGYYLAQSHSLEGLDDKSSRNYLDSALLSLNQAYRISATDPITLFRLSVCYCNMNDCSNAWKYYDACAQSDQNPMTEDFTATIMSRCKR